MSIFHYRFYFSIQNCCSVATLISAHATFLCYPDAEILRANCSMQGRKTGIKIYELSIYKQKPQKNVSAESTAVKFWL